MQNRLVELPAEHSLGLPLIGPLLSAYLFCSYHHSLLSPSLHMAKPLTVIFQGVTVNLDLEKVERSKL